MLIINNYNVWQSPVAKHCPITFFPYHHHPTTQPPPPSPLFHHQPPRLSPPPAPHHRRPNRYCHHRATTVVPSRVPLNGPSRAKLDVNHPIRHRRRRSPHATSPPATSTHPPSPPLTTHTRHITDDDDIYAPRHQ